MSQMKNNREAVLLTQDRPAPFYKEIIRVVVIFLVALILPRLMDESTIGDLSYYLLWTFLAIGLAAMWGHAGILSFGQSAFFGLAGYGYGVLTINFGDGALVTWAGLLGSLVITGLFAVLLGYMIFYGRVTGVFIGIITLSVTLVFETFMAQTAGPQWAIGKARLNGYNGMSGMPPLSLPWLGGQQITLEGEGFYYLLVALLAIVYLGTQYMLKSTFGLTLTAIKENPHRAEMLGVDIRKYQLLVFTFGGVLAGLSGTLYTVWGSYITPSSMGLTAAAMPVIWVAAAGRKNIGSVVVATIGFVWLSQWLAVYGSEYALILMGAVLLFVVLAAPEGVFSWALSLVRKKEKPVILTSQEPIK